MSPTHFLDPDQDAAFFECRPLKKIKLWDE